MAVIIVAMMIMIIRALIIMIVIAKLIRLFGENNSCAHFQGQNHSQFISC